MAWKDLTQSILTIFLLLSICEVNSKPIYPFESVFPGSIYNDYEIERLGIEKITPEPLTFEAIQQPTSPTVLLSDKFPTDIQIRSSYEKKFDWKSAFLCFSAALTVFLLMKMCIKYFQQICCNIEQRPGQGRGIRRRRIAATHLMTDAYSTRCAVLSLVPVHSSSGGSNVTAPRKVLRSNTVNSEENEATCFQTSSTSDNIVEDISNCETPPPPYSLAMTSYKLGVEGP